MFAAAAGRAVEGLPSKARNEAQRSRFPEGVLLYGIILGELVIYGPHKKGNLSCPSVSLTLNKSKCLLPCKNATLGNQLKSLATLAGHVSHLAVSILL